jgi:hypothetical protein
VLLILPQKAVLLLQPLLWLLSILLLLLLLVLLLHVSVQAGALGVWGCKRRSVSLVLFTDVAECRRLLAKVALVLFWLRGRLHPVWHRPELLWSRR